MMRSLDIRTTQANMITAKICCSLVYWPHVMVLSSPRLRDLPSHSSPPTVFQRQPQSSLVVTFFQLIKNLADAWCILHGFDILR